MAEWWYGFPFIDKKNVWEGEVERRVGGKGRCCEDKERGEVKWDKTEEKRGDIYYEKDKEIRKHKENKQGKEVGSERG